jgi:predicted AAA+ superfamily ATPase
MYTRLLLDEIKNTKKSLMILGPRQVGKSTLIHSLRPDLSINLANESEFFHLQSDPSELERRVLDLKPRPYSSMKFNVFHE